MSGHWNLTDYDRTLAAELAELLPEKVFDVHARYQ
jgi:hypothetical protein